MAHPTSARIWCRGCRKGGTKWTSIDGEGPTAEERDRLFERYEQHQRGTRWMPNPEELQRLWERYDGRNSDGEEACAEERESLFGSYEQHNGHCRANAEGQVEMWRAANAPQPNALALVPMPSPPPPPRPGCAAEMLALPPDPATQCSAPPGLLWSTVLPSYY